ncbi:MAG: hypothetical protein ACRDD2_08955 [Sarcina sp.]
MVYLFSISILIAINTMINKIEIIDGIKILKGIVPSFIVICLMIYIANKNQIKDRNFRTYRYNYLLNKFHIYVDLENKKISLIANKVEITLLINEDNIKIRRLMFSLILSIFIAISFTRVFDLLAISKIPNDVVENKLFFIILFFISFIFLQEAYKLTHKIIMRRYYIFYENSNYVIDDNYLIIKNDYIREEIDLNEIEKVEEEENFILFKASKKFYKVDKTEEIIEKILK